MSPMWDWLLKGGIIRLLEVNRAQGTVTRKTERLTALGEASPQSGCEHNGESLSSHGHVCPPATATPPGMRGMLEGCGSVGRGLALGQACSVLLLNRAILRVPGCNHYSFPRLFESKLVRP